MEWIQQGGGGEMVNYVKLLLAEPAGDFTFVMFAGSCKVLLSALRPATFIRSWEFVEEVHNQTSTATEGF